MNRSPAVNIRGIHHVALVVHDLAAARDFYVDALGLEVVDQAHFTPSPATDLLTELQAGKSIADVAAEKGVDAQTIADAGRICNRQGFALRAKQFWQQAAHLDPENVAAALRQGYSRSFAAWVVFLEDDIDVCDRFFDSVGAWLDDCARDDRRVYALGSCQVSKKSRGRAADIGIEHFFGTQAFALRRDDAIDLSAYLDEHVYDRTDTGAQYDLLMHDWALTRWPSVRHFLASVPSFVQHIGRESVIEPRPSTHLFASWPGREWSYVG